MEEGQTEQTPEVRENPTPVQQNPGGGVSFPTVGTPQKQGGPKTILIVGILILVGILGFVIYKSASKKGASTTTEPTPFDNLTVSDQGGSQSPTPVASPSVDKSTVTIQVQNGTGIAGEAAYLQTQLKNLGYTNISLGNAGDQSLTATEVTFSKNLDSGVVAEITQKLKSIYQTVNSTTSSTQTVDILIVTGLQKGATPKPVATPAPSPTDTPTPTPTTTP